MNDTAFFNEYTESFTPGNQLSFTIDTTNLLDAGGTPDLLTIGILDSSSNNLPTTGPVSEFADISLTGGTAPLIASYSSASGSQYALSAPVVTLQGSSSSVPEPSSYGMLLAMGVGLCIARMCRRSAQLRSSALK